MAKVCHICEKETKFICKSCRKLTCRDHLSGAGFVEPTGLCPKCEDAYDEMERNSASSGHGGSDIGHSGR